MKQLNAEQTKLLQALAAVELKKNELRSNLRFRCLCGKLHRIKDCKAWQMHWYERPHGCTEGDQWHAGDLQIICPVDGVRNRCLFEPPPFKHRGDFEWDARAQFRRMFTPLFKEVAQIFKRDDEFDGKMVINDYFDKHREKFGLQVKTEEAPPNMNDKL